MLKVNSIFFSLFLFLFILFSCSRPFHTEAENLILRYIEAVQKKDFQTLYALSFHIQKERDHLSEEQKKAHFQSFQREIEKKLEAYEADREKGKIQFDRDGIALIKGFVLGKGTYYQPVGWVRLSQTQAYIDTVIEFGYGHINYSTFPEGTIIYLMGHPLGRVEKLTIQRGGKVIKKVMKEAHVRWSFEKGRPSDASPSGWYIKSVGIIPDSVTYETVTWIF